MNSSGNTENQDIIHENPQSSNELLLQILQETQLKLETMERRMSEMVAQIGQNQEEVQTTSTFRAETEISKRNKTPSPKRSEKQKKKEIVADLSANIKKIKLPKFFASESGEEAE